MTNVKKVYGYYERVREIVQRKTFKRIVTSFLGIFLFLMTLNSYAQEGTISPTWEGEKEFHNIVNKVPDKKVDNSATALGQQNVTSLWAGVVYLGGEDVLDDETKQELSQSDMVPNDLRRGLIGMVSDGSDAIYANYPLVDIPGHLAQQWVPGYKESTTSLYAADGDILSGYQELAASGIIPLWTRMLNLSYVFFIVVMIIAGFMIMFRQKVGGQALVTLGNVLPRVIISLLVATFSFAIAGLIIDLGGILIGIILYVFDLNRDTANPIAYLGQIMGSVFKGGLGTTTGIIGGIGTSLGIAAILKGGGIMAIIGAASTTLLPVILLGVGVIGLLFAFIILAIIFVGAVKVLITLLKAYFQLLIAVILGPLQITLAAVPGNNAAIGNWVKSILRNVLVFPVVFFIINLPNALLNAEGDIRLRLPAKLVYEDSTYDPNGLNVAGGFFLGIFKIFVLYFAAQAPKFIESILPPSSNKGLAAGFEAAKGNMQKIPLVGGFFK